MVVRASSYGDTIMTLDVVHFSAPESCAYILLLTKQWRLNSLNRTVNLDH